MYIQWQRSRQSRQRSMEPTRWPRHAQQTPSQLSALLRLCARSSIIETSSELSRSLSLSTLQQNMVTWHAKQQHYYNKVQKIKTKSWQKNAKHRQNPHSIFLQLVSFCKVFHKLGWEHSATTGEVIFQVKSPSRRSTTGVKPLKEIHNTDCNQTKSQWRELSNAS